MTKAVCAAILVASFFATPANAQIRSAISAGSARGGMHGAARAHNESHRGYAPLYLGDPYLYGAADSSSAANNPPPNFVVLNAPPATAAQAVKTAPITPLLIEWHGDRYVRVESSSEPKNLADSPAPQKIAKANSKDSHPATLAPLQPIELVFRDGHREQVREYTIANGVLYANGNYWSDGYWTKSIQLNTLDVSATQLANQQRGTAFVLPGSANEVVIQP